MLSEKFEGAAYFLLKFYHICLTQNKDSEGCKNFQTLISDQRLTKKLNSMNVKIKFYQKHKIKH